MKKTICTITFLSLVMCPFLGTSTLEAQPVKYAQAGMPFLKIDVGGRAAMAGTQIGYVGDALSMFANPAGLAAIEGLDVMFSNTSWIADITHTGFAAAYRAGNLGVFGVSFINMDYGTFTKTIPVSFEVAQAGYQITGTFEVAEYAAGISYARQITTQFSVGGHVRFASQNLGTINVFDEIKGKEEEREQTVTNVVMDFGTLYYPGFKDFRFGMSLRNFSSQSDYYDQRFELPLSFDFGVAMDVLQLASAGNENMKLTVAFDWVHPRDFSERQHLGLEYSFMDMVFARGGYKFNYDEEGLTAGVGVKYGIGNIGLNVEYVYSDFGIFDSVSRFSVGVFMK